MSTASTDKVREELTHLYRREFGRIVAILTKIFGPAHLDLAENMVQEALMRATQVWPLQGIPSNPAGWLLQVARNAAIDAIRRDRRLQYNASALEALPDETPMTLAFDNIVQDDQLRLMFVCCHPVLPVEAQVALTLKTICGFGVSEIARAFLAKEETIAQRLVRAKQKIREANLPFALPTGTETAQRLDAVLQTIYLVFNEGYSAHAGDDLVRADICHEACRLARLLAQHTIGKLPKTYALLALLCLQSSRLAARVDGHGDVLLLADQDRSLWDQSLVNEGLQHLMTAANGGELSTYHLLAGIAASHAVAPSFAETNWAQILTHYDGLLALDPSPVVILNRAVALSFVAGIDEALQELEKIKDAPSMRNYYLYAATCADFYRRAGKLKKAVAFYNAALLSVTTEPERRFLQRRLQECGKMTVKS